MKNKNLNITGVIASILLLTVFITASFAYFGMFTVNLENKVAVNIHASTIGNTSFIATSANLIVIVPTSGMFKGNTGLAAENTATLTVNLTGAPDVLTTCTYDVVYEYDLSSEIYGSTVAVTSGATKEITLEVSSPSGTNSFANEINFAYDSTWTPKTTTVGAKKTLVKGASITSFGTNIVQNINITGRYYNLEVEQAQLGNKSFTGKIYVENNNCTVGEITARDIILLNNKINETEPDFKQNATTNEGMYLAEDDLGTSYYFRGAVDNNWVKFGEVDGKPIYWRIIRINGDGSVRLIYTGTTVPTESQKVVMTGDSTQISRNAFNLGTDNPSYVGYMYTLGKQHGYNTSSRIKNLLESWYETTTLKDNPLVSYDQILCNDRSATTDKNVEPGEIDGDMDINTKYYYGVYIRKNSNKKPILTCPTESDKFTSKNSIIGNKKLKYPVGLLTSDEVLMAGGTSSSLGNSSYYLYTSQEYWLGTPTSYLISSGYTYIFQESVYGSGQLGNNTIGSSNGIRPVISISKDAKLSGDGTWNNPYTVS